VLVYEQINASPTINRPDGTFGFSYIDYHPNFDTFLATAQQEVERVRNGKGLELTNANANVIHYSAVPWIHFTSISHARSFAFKDCIPKISFGKIVEQHKEKKMPVSIHLHHALADGYDIGKFVEHFEHLMNEAVY
jgi:chloramphenicol O-acetyltransferase type A